MGGHDDHVARLDPPFEIPDLKLALACYEDQDLIEVVDFGADVVAGLYAHHDDLRSLGGVEFLAEVRIAHGSLHQVGMEAHRPSFGVKSIGASLSIRDTLAAIDRHVNKPLNVIYLESVRAFSSN
ncbi:hypothetical protein D3C86_1760270 [compost metagenome]